LQMLTTTRGHSPALLLGSLLLSSCARFQAGALTSTISLTLSNEGGDEDIQVEVLVDLPTAPQKAPLLVWVGGLYRAPDEFGWLMSSSIAADVAIARVDAWGMTAGSADPYFWYRTHITRVLVLVVQSLLARADDERSPLFGRFHTENGLILGGHSWGAGFIVDAAAALPGKVAGILSFAPSLASWPPVVDGLASVRAPSMTIVGEMDAVNPLVESEAIYTGLGSARKALVLVRGANHLQWASPLSAETLALTSPTIAACDPLVTMARTSQNALAAVLTSAFTRYLYDRWQSSSNEGDAAEMAAWGALESVLLERERLGVVQYVATAAARRSSSTTLHDAFPCGLDEGIAARDALQARAFAIQAPLCRLLRVYANSSMLGTIRTWMSRAWTLAEAEPDGRSLLGTNSKVLEALALCTGNWQ